jgi:ABC-type branched-subunit amino acid transport system substrate-binding protein
MSDRKDGAARLRLATAVVAAVVAVAAMVGCGSSDSSDTGTSSSSGSTSTATGTAPSGTPVKFGVIYTSGSAVQNSTNVLAADKAAVAAVNARGGLAGHPVELVSCDDKGDPNQTTACARKLVDEKVAGQLGGILVNSGVVLPVLSAAKIPQIGIVPYTAEEMNAKTVYLFDGSVFVTYPFMATYAGKQGLKSTIVMEQTKAGQVLADGMKKAAAAVGGEVVATVPVQANQADWAPVIAAASRGGVDTILDLVDTQKTKQLLAANQAAGAPIKHVMTVSGFSKADASAIGGEESLANINIVGPYPPFNQDSPMMARFRDEMAAQEKSGDSEAELSKQDLASFGAWLSVQALEQIAKTGGLTGEISAATVSQALDQAKDVDLGGVIPPWTPSKPGPPGISRVSNPTAYMSIFENGEQKLLTETPLTVEQVAAGKAPPFPPSS